MLHVGRLAVALCVLVRASLVQAATLVEYDRVWAREADAKVELRRSALTCPTVGISHGEINGGAGCALPSSSVADHPQGARAMGIVPDGPLCDGALLLRL